MIKVVISFPNKLYINLDNTKKAFKTDCRQRWWRRHQLHGVYAADEALENSRWIILLLLPSTNLFKEVEEKYLEELKTFAITNSSGVQIRSIILYGDLVRPSCELGNLTNGGPTHKLCNISHIWILHFPIISSQKGTVVVTTYLSLINHTYHHYTMLQCLFISSLWFRTLWECMPEYQIQVFVKIDA